METVICYLLFVSQKNRFRKLSTVNCNAWALRLQPSDFRPHNDMDLSP